MWWKKREGGGGGGAGEKNEIGLLCTMRAFPLLQPLTEGFCTPPTLDIRAALLCRTPYSTCNVHQVAHVLNGTHSLMVCIMLRGTEHESQLD